MAHENPRDVLKRYLEDAIAAESNFEDQLRTMANEGDQSEPQRLFAQHAEETHLQYERLVARLHALGGTPSTVKSFMAHVFNLAPKTAQLGHDSAEKSTQNLMVAYAVENSEVAMYESLANAAAAAGDTETEQLAREIQAEERRTAEKVWSAIAPSARESFQKLTMQTV